MPSQVVALTQLDTMPSYTQAWQSDDFADLRWWVTTAGSCAVPVELGRMLSYGRAGGSSRGAERLMRVSELARFLAASNAESLDAREARDFSGGDGSGGGGSGAPVAYMSQHRLLHHCAVLRARAEVPPYTLGRLRSANAWLGTAGTVTPLHTDEADNLLCQLAGVKYVRLYPPAARDSLYPFRSAGNTAANEYSEVCCESPDAEKHPLFAGEGHYEEVLLSPGEALYIPRGWFHYVRALTSACSVNWWF